MKWNILHIYTTEHKMHTNHGKQVTMDAMEASLKVCSSKSLFWQDSLKEYKQDFLIFHKMQYISEQTT